MSEPERMCSGFGGNIVMVLTGRDAMHVETRCMWRRDACGDAMHVETRCIASLQH